MQKPTCTILILTYKGKFHLEFLLPTVRKVIENSPDFSIDVLIVDNGKDEPTQQFVAENFPEMKFTFSPVNDYLFSLNPYMAQIEADFIFLLNDDIKIHPNSINEALPLLVNDNELFAVHCNVHDWDNTYSAEGTRQMFYRRGWLYTHWNKTPEANEGVRYTLYTGGGSGFFRTRMFNELGGFDPLYRPAYCEDLDIGHRAWQQGWKIVRAPKSILYHREGGTIKDQFKADQLTQKVYKNQILWMVKNANYSGSLFWFWLLLPYRLLLGWRVDKNSYIALVKALPRLPLALKKRFAKPKSKIKDEDLMKILHTKYEKIVK
jgi:GT2 family glycosyltransferase